MKIYNIIRAIVSFFAVLSLGPAFAAGHPAPYVGVSIGSGDADLQLKDALPAMTTTDLKDTGFKLYAGYRFNENFAVEGGYVDLGEKTITGTNLDILAGGTTDELIKTDTNAFYASALASYPFGNFSPFAKVGFMQAKEKGDITDTDGTAAPALKISESSTGFLWGVGVAYNFTENFEVRAEWERVSFDDYVLGGSDATTDRRVEPEYDLISVGLVYNF